MRLPIEQRRAGSMLRPLLALAMVAAGFGVPSTVRAATFELTPIDFSDGMNMTGSITTDGTIGALAGDNLLDWRIAFREVSSFGFSNESNSRVFTADGASTDGQSIFVVDPDGGWAFSRWPVGPGITLIQLADFTGATAPGGQARFTNPFSYEVLKSLSYDPSYIAATMRVPEQDALLLAAIGAAFVVVSHWRRSYIHAGVAAALCATSPSCGRQSGSPEFSLFASTRCGTNVVPFP